MLREVETLSSLLLYVLHHSQAMDTVVLNALSNYQFVYFTQRRILSVLVALHSKARSVFLKHPSSFHPFVFIPFYHPCMKQVAL